MRREGSFGQKVTIKGKTAHAGEPDKGVNAIVKGSDLIVKLNSIYKKKIKNLIQEFISLQLA